MSDAQTPDSSVSPSGVDLARWSEALAGLARTGLAFTESSFEAERYHEILAIAADIRAAELAQSQADGGPVGVDRDATVETWLRMVGRRVAGYVTPKVAVGSVVGDGQGRLLLIQRADSGVWLYPTGWADIGYSASEVAEKEVQEETGIECRVERPIAILDGLRAGFGRVPLYSIVFLCRATGGELAAHPQECLDVGWFTRDDLPEPVANAELWVDHAFASIEGSADDVFFDLPRDQVWQGPQP